MYLIHGDNEQNLRYISSYNKQREKIPRFLLPAINGAGALKSTMHDMLLFLEHQMNIYDSPLKKEMAFTHQIHGDTRWKNCHMGLAWVIEQKKWGSFPIIHHDGATMYFFTYCGFIK